MNAPAALALASCLHAGFQLTVTAIVYPALTEVPADGWSSAHDHHSRRIAPVVALVYAVLLGACVWSLVAGPHGWGWVALVGALGTALVTAVAAAPTHARLAEGGVELRRRLLRVDRVRCGFAVLGAVAAVVAVL